MAALIVSGSSKALPTVGQFVLERLSNRKPPQALIRHSRLIQKNQFLNTQRQRNVGYAARVTAEAENNEATRYRGHS
jgi:hypothetical protein